MAGVGTGGTLTGVGEYLKSKKKDVEIVAVEPKSSAVFQKEFRERIKFRESGQDLFRKF